MADEKTDPVEKKKDPVSPETPEAPSPAEAKNTDTSEPMIPKSRFDEVNERAKRAEQETAQLRKAEEERKKAEMTEVERLKLEKGQAEAKAQQLERSQMQRDAADKAGLPLEFADRLKGETPDEMAADATKLLEAMPKPDKKKQERINNTVPGGLKPIDQMTEKEKSDFLWGGGNSI